MSTWTSKAPLSLLTLLLLGGCGGTGLMSGLQELNPLADATVPRTALMAEGQVRLVAPEGFCIDSASLTELFALLAPCTALEGKPKGRAEGVISVSLAAHSPDAALPTPAQKAGALGLEMAGDTEAAGEATLFQASGAAPADSLSPDHWRLIARKGPVALSASYYGPAPFGGRDLLQQLSEQTRAL